MKTNIAQNVTVFTDILRVSTNTGFRKRQFVKMQFVNDLNFVEKNQTRFGFHPGVRYLLFSWTSQNHTNLYGVAFSDIP